MCDLQADSSELSLSKARFHEIIHANMNSIKFLSLFILCVAFSSYASSQSLLFPDAAQVIANRGIATNYDEIRNDMICLICYRFSGSHHGIGLTRNSV